MRKIPILAAAVFVILLVPRVASAQAQHCFFFNQAPPCSTTMAPMPSPWKNVTFGPATFVKPPVTRSKFVTVTGAQHTHRSVRVDFLDPRWFIRR